MAINLATGLVFLVGVGVGIVVGVVCTVAFADLARALTAADRDHDAHARPLPTRPPRFTPLRPASRPRPAVSDVPPVPGDNTGLGSHHVDADSRGWFEAVTGENYDEWQADNAARGVNDDHIH